MNIYLRILPIILVSAILWLPAGCSRNYDVQDRLNRAEALMESAPDSALLILESINASVLRSEPAARFAVLITRAQDKNNIVVTDDSLISLAVRFYENKNNISQRMLANYYYGIVQMNNEDYSAGIVALLKALDCAEKLNDNFWTGMSCRAISDIYDETFNSNEALEYAKKAYKHFKAARRQDYTDYALLDLAINYQTSGNLKQTYSLCRQLTDSAVQHKNPDLSTEAQRLVGLTQLSDNRFRDALKTYRSFCTAGRGNASDSTYLCLAYLGCDSIAMADSVFHALNFDDILMKEYLRYKISKKRNLPSEALSAIESLDSLSNIQLYAKARQNITRSVITHFDLVKQQALTDKKYARLTMWYILVISTFILAIIIISYIHYRKRQQAKIERNIIIAEELRHLLTCKERDFSNAEETIRQLLTSKYKLFDDLCQMVYQSNNASSG